MANQPSKDKECVMTSEFLLETLEHHFKTILARLSNEEKNTVIGLLRQIMASEDDHAIADTRNRLYNFCLGNRFLKELLLKAKATEAKPIVFRGKPIPKSTTAESKRIRLKANRLIDAIEKENYSPAEQKHENPNG
jgi:hypothetical protein